MSDRTVYWCYNRTFGYYHDVPLAGKRAHDFIDGRNKCKGGVWELHTVDQHREWYDSKGKHLDALSYDHSVSQPIPPGL